MSLRFAPARQIGRSPVARALAPGRAAPAANDDRPIIAGDPILRAAIEHFAAHGLGAAREAHRRAEQARSAGDDAQADRWRAICRMLDRRLAASLARR